MIFLYLVVAAVWCFFWVKGRLWAAVPVPVLMAAIEWVSYRDQHHFDPPLGLAWIFFLSLAALVPYAIHRRRAARMDRALNGLRLTDAD